jgi:hypothetical protein
VDATTATDNSPAEQPEGAGTVVGHAAVPDVEAWQRSSKTTPRTLKNRWATGHDSASLTTGTCSAGRTCVVSECGMGRALFDDLAVGKEGARDVPGGPSLRAANLPEP